MKNHLKSLAVAAMLAGGVSTGAAPQAGVQNEISQVLTSGENEHDTLSFGEEKVRLQIESQINEAMKDKKLKKLVKFYGEDGVKSRIYEMINEVCKNPDKYGTFDSKGNFILNDDFFGDVGRSLFRSKFVEYEFNNLEHDASVLGVVLGIIAMVGIVGGLSLAQKMVEYKDYSEGLEIENKGLREQIQKMENGE